MRLRTHQQPRLVWALIMLAAACSEPGPTAPVGPPALSMAVVTPGKIAPGDELPFRLDASTAFAGQDLAPDFGPPLFGKSEFDGRCSVPSDFVIRFVLDGQATHLGHLTGSVEHCSQLNPMTGVLTVTDGEMTLAAASGDELHATYSGQQGPQGLEEHVILVGGTGMFASASGGGVAHPACDPSTGTCVFTLEGVVAYDARDGSDG